MFAYLIAGRYGTPFVVASKIGLGGLVFLAGRFIVVAIHETAHALAMASFGRKVDKAGFKLLFIFPYAFVDTSEAWFEPRRRRIAISAAGPVSDFSVGAVFSLCCLLLPDGTVRDIFFNLAFAAYVGAFFNLNPFIDRDGYQILVDVLKEPGLRRRAKEQFSRKLSGKGDDADRLARARALLALRARVVLPGRVLRDRHDPALQARDRERGCARVRGLDRADHDLGRVLHPGDRHRRQAAGGSGARSLRWPRPKRTSPPS